MKVSVIIPCYNVEKYIARSVRSVFAQEHEALEVICVDDGSSDGTSKELSGLQKEARCNFQIITQDNAGASAARNAGIAGASGEYIQFLDADDYLEPGKIARQVQIATEGNEPDLIVAGYRRVDERGRQLDEKNYRPNQEASIWLGLMKTDLGCTCSNLFGSRFFREGRGWRPGLGSSQEYTLMFDILKQGGRVAFDEEVLTTVTKRVSGSISHTNPRGNWLRYIELRAEILDYARHHKTDLPLPQAYQILFDAIRTLYGFDAEGAIAYYQRYIPASFSPTPSPATSRSYLMAYKLLGFERAEQITRLYRGWF